MSDRATTDLEQVLVVQGHDTAIDQLNHRRENLAERAELEAALQSITRLDAALRDNDAARDALLDTQRRFEEEVSGLEGKKDQVSRALATGTVPRELRALQEEHDGLSQRQRLVEDRIIEVMEQLEPLDAEHEQLVGERAALDARSTTLLATIAEAEVSIESELATQTAQRADEATRLPEPLLTEYERLRARLGGVGAARLTGDVCGGCHLSLSAVEVDRIRHLPPETLVHCDECGRLLVH
jgi:predicted  nucleic acid-binding Zn-ribbon protein